MAGIMIRQEMGQGCDPFVTRIRLDSGGLGEVARGGGCGETVNDHQAGWMSADKSAM